MNRFLEADYIHYVIRTHKHTNTHSYAHMHTQAHKSTCNHKQTQTRCLHVNINFA